MRAAVIALAGLSAPSEAFNLPAAAHSSSGGWRTAAPVALLPFDTLATSAALQDTWSGLEALATPQSHLAFISSALAGPLNWALSDPPPPRRLFCASAVDGDQSRNPGMQG